MLLEIGRSNFWLPSIAFQPIIYGCCGSSNPAQYFELKGKAISFVPYVANKLASHLVSEAMPDLVDQAKSPIERRSASSFQFIELLISDLIAARLITLQPLNGSWTAPEFGEPQSTGISSGATDLGNDFLAFITSEEIHHG